MEYLEDFINMREVSKNTSSHKKYRWKSIRNCHFSMSNVC